MIDQKPVLVRVTDSEGREMTLKVHGEDTLTEWESHLKTIMTFLGFSVDEVEINPEREGESE